MHVAGTKRRATKNAYIYMASIRRATKNGFIYMASIYIYHGILADCRLCSFVMCCSFALAPEGISQGYPFSFYKFMVSVRRLLDSSTFCTLCDHVQILETSRFCSFAISFKLLRKDRVDISQRYP